MCIVTLIDGGTKCVLCESTGRGPSDACTWYLPPDSAHMPFPFVDGAWHALAIINQSHEYNPILRPVSLPRELPNLKVVLGVIQPLFWISRQGQDTKAPATGTACRLRSLVGINDPVAESHSSQTPHPHAKLPYKLRRWILRSSSLQGVLSDSVGIEDSRLIWPSFEPPGP